ncbi:MAG: 5-oxoprolinase subunit PxpB [Dehalococcoidia bacterium]
MIYDRPRFLPGGDSALFVEFGDVIDPELNRRVSELHFAIQQADLTGIVESVPAYGSLLVYYEPLLICSEDLMVELERLARRAQASAFPGPMVTEIPTLYGGEQGRDLDFVAQHNGLSAEEVIQLHSERYYLIYMLGFIPGFPYLGGMSPRISAPRLATPRAKIPAGSVGIAGGQTGVYPAESPGGWRIIGRTPLELFHAGRRPPALLQTGNYVRFVRITGSDFSRISEQLQLGTYRIRQYAFAGETQDEGV